MVDIKEKEFSFLADYIHANYGIYLRKEKMTLVRGRLQTVLEQAGFDNFTDYLKYVFNDKTGAAMATLIDKITTNHTFFMREANQFYYFRDTVLPYLISIIRDRDLRIWCAASSTGEEAYTLAMVIDEFLNREKPLWDAKVLATDISDKVLKAAREGIYENERLAPLPAHWKLNYFKKYDSDRSVVTDKIRNEVIYRKFNLMDETFPFKKKFHTIFCRNVMIYFDNETRNRLVEKFYDHMADGGYLFIGNSESLSRETKFHHVMPSVYRKE